MNTLNLCLLWGTIIIFLFTILISLFFIIKKSNTEKIKKQRIHLFLFYLCGMVLLGLSYLFTDLLRFSIIWYLGVLLVIPTYLLSFINVEKLESHPSNYLKKRRKYASIGVLAGLIIAAFINIVGWLVWDIPFGIDRSEIISLSTLILIGLFLYFEPDFETKDNAKTKSTDLPTNN